MLDIVIIKYLVVVLLIIVASVAIALLLDIRRKSKGDFSKALTHTALGLVPLVIFHLLEELPIFNIELLLFEELVHPIHDITVIIAILSFTWLLYWFRKIYVNPIYKK